MKKVAMTLTAASLLVTGLAGCGDVNDAGMNDTRTGYSTNFGQDTARGYGTTANDYVGSGNYPSGSYPIREERNFGSAYDYHTGNGNVTGQNNRGNKNTSAYEARENRNHRGFGRGITGDDQPGMVDENGILNRQDSTVGEIRGRDNTRGFNRRNHEGALNDTRGQNQTMNGYFDSEDGRLATRISDRLAENDISDSHVIVHGDDIIIGADHDGDEAEFQGSVRANLDDDIVGNRNVHVVTDRNHVRNIRGMNDRLRGGEPFEEIGATFNDMIQDIGNAVQRPFERSR
ncbi:YhcN/YlaJ family sporulation lipoprotein [Evansella sp. AB-P1]|uniref:YhcN/YlaJ family sporulation lipoprotein n=1 Tax=Evansella sp. AB-P1 TaxID=3037653 RepID=UPI00241C6620|nr:YhcN/YlaJ family sporulation lipoprotein [Evansella sp. AB-P1]MDG5786428.1 YhcN/YlaJ family sporulation lipoprotein [Evansella sp. AB-P1]